MRNLFIFIYDWFEKHKVYLYVILGLLVTVCGILASQVKFEENIFSFFDDGNGEKNDLKKEVFEGFKLKDKIVVLITGPDPDLMVETADLFCENILALQEQNLISTVVSGVDAGLLEGTVDFFYRNLPIYLENEDYEKMDQVLLTDEGIHRSLENVFSALTSPSGMFLGPVMMRDPLDIGTHLLKKMERFQTDVNYEIYSGYIFTPDLKNLMIYIDPSNSMGDTGTNDLLVKGLEEAVSLSEKEGTEIEFIGGPVVAVYNARQIKRDTALTVSIALLILIPVILFSFRRKRYVPLILLPPLMGALFSLAVIFLIKGTISAIAIGAGTVVLGISLSYSIHIISHSNHTTDPRQIILDLAYPLTVGCLTTIGAFFALMFTSSVLLQDMGLFSALTLIGTTLFSLIFLPHFIGGGDVQKKNGLLNLIEKVNCYSYENKKWILLLISSVTLICLFFYREVEFDDNMDHINYVPKHVQEAENRLDTIIEGQSRQVYIVSSENQGQNAYDNYKELIELCGALCKDGQIKDYVSVIDLYVPMETQALRIQKWNDFWKNRRDTVLETVSEYANRLGFRSGAFRGFEDLLNRDYTVCHFSEKEISDMPVLSEWMTIKDSTQVLISRIELEQEQKESVYRQIDSLGGNIVIDRAYFSSKMVSNTSDDFNFILFLSSLLVFVALLLSYGRIELTLMTFLPMCISWIIILGIMAMLDIRFNIVNVILATFIFGIGDDFSIFIMDGLLEEYKNGRKLFNAHKVAIFFSAFTTIIGMGVLIFAQHPALKSIAFISVLGLCVVVLVSYTIQPYLFKLLISGPVKRGAYPHTLLTILRTAYAFIYFLLGCIVLQIMLLVLAFLPLRKSMKKEWVHYMIYAFTRSLLFCIPSLRVQRIHASAENMKEPAVIIANHQSFVDILLLLSLSPKMIMVTNDWVWNSPFFGRIIRYIDFQHAADGYEKLSERIRSKVQEGYSVVVFPEGTRSADCSIQRFHKGAFYLASILHLDLLPVLLYGPGQISSKKQSFYIKKGILVCRLYPRLKYGDLSMGETYQQQSKAFRQWYKSKYQENEEIYGHADNLYFREALLKNYIYKGPVLEWYMRIKCRLDGYYDLWDRKLPRQATITDVGCGYGQLSMMLSMLSSQRTVIGIDYDQDKVDLANHLFLCRNNVRFVCANMKETQFEFSDAFLFNDSLHYVSSDAQRKILQACLEKMNPNGCIMVRDGAADRERHAATVQTEVWSTQILKFNRTEEKLRFVSKSWMQEFALLNHLDLEILDYNQKTSETLYIFTRSEEKL